MGVARAWIAGYGSKLVPHEPFEIARLGDTERVVCAHHGASGVRQVLAEPLHDGVGFKLGPGTGSLGDTYAFAEDDERAESTSGWRIGTRGFECGWPAGWTLWSTSYEVDHPFELSPSGGALPRDAMIYVRGPWPSAEAAPLEALIASGMRELGRRTVETPVGRAAAIDLAYMHDGVEWWQARIIAPIEGARVVLVTAQAPRAAMEPVRAAADEVARGSRSRNVD
ncbi:MAG: hypothetical protein AB7S26_02715 [Sandaracinaceae bacterium]